MITVDELCAEMERSGRRLTARSARDWWTKGLLPRPQRRGLGRKKGTLTFWPNPKIVEQAQAADDLLARHSRTYTVIIGLWLWGFPVDLRFVRRAYLKLIDRHQHTTRKPDDWIAALAPRFARRSLKRETPAPIREGMTDVVIEFLNAFYSLDNEAAVLGLAAHWAEAVPYMLNFAGEQQFALADQDLEWLVVHLRDWASLPSQREALLWATDYDLSRARRVIHLAFGCCARLTPPAKQEELEDFGRETLLALGRPTLLILVRLLSEPLGAAVVPFLLKFGAAARQAAVADLPQSKRLA